MFQTSIEELCHRIKLFPSIPNLLMPIMYLPAKWCPYGYNLVSKISIQREAILKQQKICKITNFLYHSLSEKFGQFSLWHHMHGYLQFFFRLKLLPPYPLCSQGNDKECERGRRKINKEDRCEKKKKNVTDKMRKKDKNMDAWKVFKLIWTSHLSAKGFFNNTTGHVLVVTFSQNKPGRQQHISGSSLCRVNMNQPWSCLVL